VAKAQGLELRRKPEFLGSDRFMRFIASEQLTRLTFDFDLRWVFECKTLLLLYFVEKNKGTKIPVAGFEDREKWRSLLQKQALQLIQSKITTSLQIINYCRILIYPFTVWTQVYIVFPIYLLV
jgi:hypothetical protein